MGVYSDRVDSSAARWKTRSTSNSARMRSSSAVSVIDPVNSLATCGATRESSGATSIVIIGELEARLETSAWPISPPPPVMRMTGLRIVFEDDGVRFRVPVHARRPQHVRRRVGHDDDHEPADVVERQRLHDQR